jgi:CRP-like cAMP-binding protein/HEAT repeat protein
MGRYHIVEGNYQQARQYLIDIRSSLEEEGKDRDTVKIATQPMLEQLLADYLDGPKQWEAGKLLTDLDADAVHFLIDRLGKSESRAERKKLIALVIGLGETAQKILTEQLSEDAPWFIIRNSIQLLGELGDSSCLDKVIPNLNHPDLRVQKESLNTVNRLGGTHKKKILEDALSTIDESLLGYTALLLGELGGEGVTSTLNALFQKSGRLGVKYREEVQEKVCVALGKTGSSKAIPILNNIAHSTTKLGFGGPSEKVRSAAATSIRRIETALEKDALAKKAQARAQDVAHKILHQASLDKREEAIFQLATQGEVARAKEELVELIDECAQNKDFGNAERLRERLQDIDPLALSEIIRSGEVIEKEKETTPAGDEFHRWAGLTEQLTTGEFNCLYRGMEPVEYAPNEIIVSQGESNNQLFFIYSGSVKISHISEERELFIKSLTPGDLAGENFFSASIWTATLTALTSVQAYLLHRDKLKEWAEEFPGLDAKLREYYNRSDDVAKVLRKKGLERRRFERFAIARKLQVQVIDKQGKHIGRPFRGELAGISQGGIAFLIRISTRESSHMLLGRNIEVIIPVGGKQKELILRGLVIAIQIQDQETNDYSIHVKFSDTIDLETLQLVLG